MITPKMYSEFSVPNDSGNEFSGSLLRPGSWVEVQLCRGT